MKLYVFLISNPNGTLNFHRLILGVAIFRNLTFTAAHACCVTSSSGMEHSTRKATGCRKIELPAQVNTKWMPVVSITYHLNLLFSWFVCVCVWFRFVFIVRLSNITLC